MQKELKVTPTTGVPIPTDFKPEEIPDLLARAKAAFNTAEFLIRNGLELKPGMQRPAHLEAVNQATGEKSASRRPYNSATALWLDDLLDKYNNAIVEDSIRLKSYVTTRLVEESDPEALGEKAADRLRALESLGRLSQLGMFADKVEISVNHKSTDELKDELSKKLSRYMGDIEEVKAEKREKQSKRPAITIDLDVELGRNKDKTEVETDD
jgi:hypothetical protein